VTVINKGKILTHLDQNTTGIVYFKFNERFYEAKNF